VKGSGSSRTSPASAVAFDSGWDRRRVSNRTDSGAEVRRDPGIEMGHDGGVATRILTVEDDSRILKALCLALEDEGYDVAGVHTAEEALVGFRENPYDVVLVDLMLPGMNGFDLCRELRKSSAVPIVVVTARSDTHDVVAGLEAGADDYVTKPVNVKELAARIRSLLRRIRAPGGVDPGRLEFDDLEILPDSGVVRRGGRAIDLTKTEFRLLCELAFNAGLILTREQLLELVWGYDYFGDSRLVDAHIRRLRTKIEDDSSKPRFIVTVRGLGYKLLP
jgi:DNA-binding response OmpR family regulator